MLNWSYGPFEIPDAIYREWDCRAVGRERESKWNALFDTYRTAFPDLAARTRPADAGELPTNWSAALDEVARCAHRQSPKTSKRAKRRSAV